MTELNELLSRLVTSNEKHEERYVEQQAKIAEQQGQIAELLKTLKVPPPGPNNVALRAEKVQKINFNLRKSARLKPFRVSADSDIKLFLKRFDEELQNMKAMVGLNDVLSREEYVPIFRSCLDFPIVERVGQVLTSMGKTWATITIAELTKLMKDEFGSKQTDVANVLKQFGPQRLAKTPDESVAEFYFRWQQNIPEIMKPSDNDGYKEFVDLMHRSMFYISLEDEFLQKALSDMKEPKPDLKKYFDEACNAESRRMSFQDISKSNTSVENKGVSISKWDVSQKKKWVNKSDKITTPGVKHKTDVSTHGDNAKFGNKGQKQQNFPDKTKQNSQSSDQNKANKK